MLDIARDAVQQLIEYRNRRGPESCVRIGILSGSASGPSLGVSIDEITEKDAVFEFDALQVIIDRALMDYCEHIAVEYVQQKGGSCSGGGFKLTPKNSV